MVLRAAAALVLASLGGASGAIDQAGDCAFVWIISDFTDGFGLLLLDNMAADETIYVTDNGASGEANLLTTAETVLYYTAEMGVTAGTVLTMADFTYATGVSPMSVDDAGDQLLAYTSASNPDQQGAESVSTFLCAISTNAWHVNGETPVGTTKSWLPSGLTDGSTSLSFNPHKDNGLYNRATLTGTVAQLQSKINNVGNWNLDDNAQNLDEPVASGYTVTQGSGGNGDPHITFAHGGRADFRGSHRASYAFLSSPDYQFAPYFQEVDFDFTSPSGVKQLVHGTYMTRAHWRVRASTGEELLIVADAMRKGEVDLLVFPPPSAAGEAHGSSGASPSRTVALKQWSNASHGDVTVATRMLTVAVLGTAWKVEATSKPIYGLIEPSLNETHYHGKWEPNQRRFDIKIEGAFPQEDAHGVIGQSYRDSVVRHGRLDEYGAASQPELVSSDFLGPEMWTSAQAEGAIDGVHTDYALSNPFSTRFSFSRYGHARAASALTSSPTAFRTSWTSERLQPEDTMATVVGDTGVSAT